VRACQTPVFRYALEKWPADFYLLLIYHKGSLDDRDKATVDWLEKVQETEASQIRMYTVDLSIPMTKPASRPATMPASSPASQPAAAPVVQLGETVRMRLLKEFPPPENVSEPVMVLRYPARRTPTGTIWDVAWSGPLTARSAQQIVDSPTRQKVAKRLLSGDSTVWVFLESGDKEKDDAAAKLLQGELDRMNKTLKLPEQSPAPPGGGFYEPEVVVELKLFFSMLRMSRTDPAEKMFVEMLLGSEEGLKELDGPMAFPIFGQGRALAAFVGDGINADNIEDASIFLVGRCSCQVKWMNPGTDMLFSVDWQAGLAGQPMMTTPPLPRMARDEVEIAETASLRTRAGIDDLSFGGDKMVVGVVVAVGAVIAAVVVMMLWVTGKGQRA